MMAAATADYRLMKYTPKTRNQGGHGGTAPTEILFVLLILRGKSPILESTFLPNLDSKQAGTLNLKLSPSH
jgi:hypothetical protein